jgi:hypothetical protein
MVREGGADRASVYCSVSLSLHGSRICTFIEGKRALDERYAQQFVSYRYPTAASYGPRLCSRLSGGALIELPRKARCCARAAVSP